MEPSKARIFLRLKAEPTELTADPLRARIANSNTSGIQKPPASSANAERS